MPTLNESERDTLAKMKTVADIGDGTSWKEITSEPEAVVATRLSGTAIVIFFQRESKVEEGGHPRRWFMLVEEGGPDPKADVTLCTLPPGVDAKEIGLRSNSHTTGYRNANPYPEFSDQIDTLSEVIGVEIEPNWQGEPLPEIEAVPAVSPRPR